MAITFDSIGGGELAGMFKAALAHIGQNIMDPNMDPEAARGMAINIKFKPSKAGTIAVTYDIKTKLAGAAKSETTFLIGQDARTGKIEMSEYGVNLARMEACDDVQVVSQVHNPVPQPQEFDPETGEIYGQPGRPIDLRQQAGAN